MNARLYAAIPRDVSVVGFNDCEGASFHPALTSVREFPEELGRHLAQFALNRIKHPSFRCSGSRFRLS